MKDTFEVPVTVEKKGMDRTLLIKHLWVHLFIFVSVNTGNFLISRIKDMESDWAFWLCAAWSAALVIHAANLIDSDMLLGNRRHDETNK